MIASPSGTYYAHALAFVECMLSHSFSNVHNTTTSEVPQVKTILVGPDYSVHAYFLQGLQDWLQPNKASSFGQAALALASRDVLGLVYRGVDQASSRKSSKRSSCSTSFAMENPCVKCIQISAE
jgi:hypothetical protein